MNLKVGLRVKTNGNGGRVMRKMITGEITAIDKKMGYFFLKRDDGIPGLGDNREWVISLLNEELKVKVVE